RLQLLAAAPLHVVDDASPVEAAMQADGDEPGLGRHETGTLGHQRQRLGLLVGLGFDDGDLGDGLVLGSDLGHARPPWLTWGWSSKSTRGVYLRLLGRRFEDDRSERL